jgi:hypothetical protein
MDSKENSRKMLDFTEPYNEDITIKFRPLLEPKKITPKKKSVQEILDNPHFQWDINTQYDLLSKWVQENCDLDELQDYVDRLVIELEEMADEYYLS